MRRRSRLTLLAPLALLAGGLVACGGTPTSAYCDRVTDDQTRLAQVLSDDRPDALITALPILADLQAHATPDIAPDWTQVITAVEGLRDALAAAHVDPATYSAAKPPPGLSAADRAAIKGAATELGGEVTLTALTNLDQQSRDVCHTTLTL